MFERRSRSGRGCLPVLLVFAATVLAYLPAIRGGFVWDDDRHVTRPGLQSLRGLERIWFELGATQQYYPALHSAFWLEHRLWGDSPLGYHLANVLFHAAAACLFALVLRRLAIPGAWLAALIFALHPVCVESVAWISEQKNTLSLVFYLLAALAYLRFEERRQASDGNRRDVAPYLLATALFVLALLTKSVTATLPAALLVALWWKRGRLPGRREVAPLVPWFGLGAAVGLLTVWVERRWVGAEGAAFALTGVQRGLIAGRAVGFYLGRLFWPADLVFIYPHWEVSARTWWQYAYPLGVLALFGAAWAFRGRSRGWLAALLFFVGSLFPALGFFNVYPFIFSYVADHFQYLASLGAIALVAAGWTKWANRSAATIAAVAAVGALAVLTSRQGRMYRDAATLYRVTLERNPSSWMAHNNLGLLLADSGHLPEAISHYEEALRLKPDYALGEFDLGNALRAAGRSQEAIVHYKAALRLQPDDPEAENNLGATLVDAGRLTEAVGEYETALRLKSDYAPALVGLSAADLKLGRTAEAVAAAEKALQSGSDDSAAHTSLGNALLRAGRPEEAIRHYEEAVRLEPGSAGAQYNLANGLVHAGRLEESIARFREAVRLKPDFVEAHQNLGAVERSLGRSAEAAAELDAAARWRAAGPARN